MSGNSVAFDTSVAIDVLADRAESLTSQPITEFLLPVPVVAAVEAFWPMSVLRTERQAALRMHVHEGGESSAEPERTALVAML